ncbi:MAG: glycogen debranching protein GlgX [Deltaproteobacteria bacterium]|nr:glycogen debranching protein GlgX [Deltaproteobacteria bacterium]
MTRVWPGRPDPIGATWDGAGVNFALFSENADGVELCLFDDETTERERISIVQRSGDVWHAYLPDLRPGQRYGYRVRGAWAPARGHRFNPHKLLADPYARAFTSGYTWNDALAGQAKAAQGAPPSPDETDTASLVPKALVVDGAFAWGDDRLPRIPWTQAVLYECHVKGMTKLHPAVPEELRGTFLGLASEPMIEHYTRLGVTTLELLPVHQAGADAHLASLGLTNYWGYNTIGFFAPDVRFATRGGDPVVEFRSMVRRLHRAGLEVVLDVVYNHTGENGPLGPTLCFRGIDNASYYRLLPEDLAHYEDVTGCGNSLDVRHPRTLQLVLDSLRYWAVEMHVDGFRFDLAPALARDPHEFSRASRFLFAVAQDPVLSRLKLIAEPWDLGPGGYQLGAFPAGWAEWNDRYRQAVRRFWRGDEGLAGELASRLAGSSDVFAAGRRGPFASINYVTCHDGFTLADLVSYERKHNEANGEDGRDGTDDNASRNWGAEGPTSKPEIVALRERMQRNLVATLLFSQGVPMLSHGDEIGRTQRGNNNAYCHDDALAWVSWDLDDARRRLLDFVRTVVRIRHENPALRRSFFFDGHEAAPGAPKDVTWLRPDGVEMSARDWAQPENPVFGMWIRGGARHDLDEQGRPVLGATLLLVLNADSRSRPFVLPPLDEPGTWRELIDTGRSELHPLHSDVLRVAAQSLVLLVHETDSPLESLA